MEDNLTLKCPSFPSFSLVAFISGAKKIPFAGSTVDETTGRKYITNEPEITMSSTDSPTRRSSLKKPKLKVDKYIGKEYIAHHGGGILDLEPDVILPVPGDAALQTETGSEASSSVDGKFEVSQALEKYYEMAADWAVEAMVGGQDSDNGDDSEGESENEGESSVEHSENTETPYSGECDVAEIDQAALSEVVVKQEVDDIDLEESGEVDLGTAIAEFPTTTAAPTGQVKHSLSFLESSKSRRKRKTTVTSKYQDYNLL